MVTVRLLGALGDRFGKEFELEITTPREAIRAIGYQIDGFFSYLVESAQNGIGYRVIPPAIPDGILETELENRFEGDILIIAPEIAQGGAVARIILGVALIGLSFFMPAAFLGISSLTVGLLGASLVYGGIAQLLTPPPPGLGSATFGAFQDRSASQGKCMPLRYGEGWCVPLRMSGRIIISNTVYTDISQGGKGGKTTTVRNTIDTQYPNNYSFDL